MTQHVQAEAIEESHSSEKEASKLDIKIEASDDGEMGQYEFIKDFSTKVTIVSDGNDTETFTISVTNSENEVVKSDQDMPQQAQTGTIKKSNYFEKEVSEPNAKIDKDEKEVKNQFSKLCMFGYSVKPAGIPTKILETLL